MGAPNFKTMDDFPLIIADNSYHKVCPECGETCGTDDKVCPECGEDLSIVDETPDEIADEDTYRNMQAAADNINRDLEFLKVEVEGGYYFGLQFYVKDEQGSPVHYDDEYCGWNFGKSREEAIAAYGKEVQLVRDWLIEKRDELGLDELKCAGRFSNGEAVYERIERECATAVYEEPKAA